MIFTWSIYTFNFKLTDRLSRLTYPHDSAESNECSLWNCILECWAHLLFLGVFVILSFFFSFSSYFVLLDFYFVFCLSPYFIRNYAVFNYVCLRSWFYSKLFIITHFLFHSFESLKPQQRHTRPKVWVLCDGSIASANLFGSFTVGIHSNKHTSSVCQLNTFLFYFTIFLNENIVQMKQTNHHHHCACVFAFMHSHTNNVWIFIDVLRFNQL